MQLTGEETDGRKNRKRFDQIELLLEKPFWVVDPLPYQVPAEGEGQFFAVEKFFLESPLRCLLLQKHARILLKINCYYDIWVAEGENERWIRNPDPASVYRLATEERRFLNILLGEDVLIVLSDFDMTSRQLTTLKYLYNKKINVFFFPKGLTGILQPLDTSLNRPFKDWIKRSYEEAVSLLNGAKGAKIKREVILNLIYTNWFDNEKIKTEIIKNAFLYCGISNNMDGSKDDLFKGFNLLNERGFIEDDFNDEDKEDMNNDIKVQNSDISSMRNSDEEIEKEKEN